MSAENAQTLDKANYMHKEDYALLQDLEECQQSILGDLPVLVNDNNLDNTQVQELVLNDQLLNTTFTAVTLPDGTQAYIAQNNQNVIEEEAASKVDESAIFLQDLDLNGKVIQLQLNPLTGEYITDENPITTDVPNQYSQLQVVDGVLYLISDQIDLQSIQNEMPKNDSNDDSNDQNEENNSTSILEFPQEDSTIVQESSHNSDRPYSCTHPNCKKSFSTSYSLKAHLRTHTGEKPYKCTNEECDKCFKTSGDLLKHIRTHTGERPFVCPFEGCGRSFTTSNIRKVHIRTHTGERPFKCPQPKCGKAFASSTNYKNHIRIHSGEKPYACSIKNCGRRFTEYSSLYKHQIVHTQEKPYVCEICQRQYRQHSTLAVHKKSAHAIIDSDPDSVLDVLLENSAEMIDQAKELEMILNKHLHGADLNTSDESQALLFDDPSQLMTLEEAEEFDQSEDDIDMALKDLNINMLLNLDEINRH